MLSNFFLCLVTILFVGHARTQQDCDVTTQEIRKQKQDLLVQVKNNTEFISNLFYTFFEDDMRLWVNSTSWGYQIPYLTSLLRKYNDDFKDIEEKFNVKMQIVNETIDNRKIIKTHKDNLQRYQKQRERIMDKYYSDYRSDYFLYDVFRTYNKDEILSATRCGVCGQKYDACLKKEVDELKKGLDGLSSYVSYYVEEIKKLDETKRWHFVNNARKASTDVFNSLNRTISVEQVKQYYTPKLVALNEEITTRYRDFHNNWRTQTFISGGKRIMDVFQLVLNSMEERNVDGSLLRNVFGLINKYVSPYEKLPVWDLNTFAAKYIRSVVNMTNVDVLIKVLEDVYRAGDNDVPWSSHLAVDVNENVYAAEIAKAVYGVYVSSGVVDVKDARFQCLGEVVKSRGQKFVAEYLKDGTGGGEVERCVNQTLGV